MREKSWTYSEITERAEKKITGLMEMAVKAEAHADRELTWVYRNAALGAWLLWDQLTMGWQQDGDSDRMNALLRPSKEGS